MNGSLDDLLRSELGGLVEQEDTSADSGHDAVDLEEIEKLAEAMDRLAGGEETEDAEEETPELDVRQILQEKLASIVAADADDNVEDKDDDELREDTMNKIAQLVPEIRSDPDREKKAQVKSVLDSWVAAAKEKVASSASSPSTPRALAALLGKGGEND